MTSDSTPSHTSLPGRGVLRRARALLGARDLPPAITLLEHLLSGDPGNMEARLLLGAALYRRGAAHAALEEFGAALRDAPASPQALCGRGLALHALGRRAEALDAFRQGVICEPLAWRAWQSIADITPDEDERLHAIEGAADALTILCARRRASPMLIAAAASALIAARETARAVRFLEARGARQGGAPILARGLARALCHKGDFEAAFRLAVRILDMPAALPGPEPAAARFEPSRALAVLTEIRAILAAAGLESFLAAGTLLGFHRAGGPLAHDRDIDLGILRTPGQGPDIASVLRAHPDIVLARINRPGDRYFPLCHRGVAVDIFLYDASGGSARCGLSHVPGDIQWRFTPFDLALRTYGGQAWSVPDPPERYLAETYGAGWQVPDTGFASAVSSPALFETSVHARAFYAAMRARRALEAGDRDRAISLARQSPVPFQLPAAAPSPPGV